jgi:hypothetical protein
MKANAILEKLTSRINVVSIVSAGNVADSPSRQTSIEEIRRKATFNCVIDALKGRRTGTPERYPNVNTGGLRHEEGVDGFDDDIELDQLPEFCHKRSRTSDTKIPRGSTTRHKRAQEGIV